MDGDYEKPMLIYDVINNINSRKWILPRIQRNFVWDTERIINLFDSIMQGFPIGTLMIWKVSDKETIKKVGFYDFLQNYQERFRETCSDYTPTTTEVEAVIDGQQRLNSLYIGLTGSYAEKLPRKKWKKSYDPAIQPAQQLYLNLCEYETSSENERKFKLAFMSKETFEALQDKHHWFKISEIMTVGTFENSMTGDEELENALQKLVDSQQIENELQKNAYNILKRLYSVIYKRKIINYYLEDSNNLDRVVEIFVRTNSGGVPLAFSDLVMSVTVAEWPEARTKIDELVTLIRTETGIEISRDFILKAFLYVFSEDIKFRVSNFSSDLIKTLKEKLDDLSEHIKSVCIFTKQIGLNNDAIRAKYALLPLIYYSYKNNMFWHKSSKNDSSKDVAAVWLKLALLKGFFGGSPDSALLPIRKIINENIKNPFPAKQIIDHFVSSPRNLNLTDDDILTRINETSFGTVEARIILSIVTEVNQEYSYEHVDHLYPKSMFTEKSLNSLSFLDKNKTLKNFYKDRNNWNTLGNLQLLNESANTSKNKEKLSVWLPKNQQYISSLILPYDEKNKKYIYEDDQFETFIEKRRQMLFDILKSKVTF